MITFFNGVSKVRIIFVNQGRAVSKPVYFHLFPGWRSSVYNREEQSRADVSDSSFLSLPCQEQRV